LNVPKSTRTGRMSTGWDLLCLCGLRGEMMMTLPAGKTPRVGGWLAAPLINLATALIDRG
jgi:hypothetical protein